MGLPDASTDQQLLHTAELGKMYEQAISDWWAGDEAVDWESLDQTDWEK